MTLGESSQSPEIHTKERSGNLVINVPEKTKTYLRRGVENMLNEIQQIRPDFLITIDRSGSLLYTAVAKAAEKRNMELPPQIRINAGRALFHEFKQQVIAEKYGREALWEEDATIYETHESEIQQWIGRYWSTKSIISRLHRTTHGAHRILIVDDSEISGVTLRIATLLVEKALESDTGTTATEIETKTISPNGDWLLEIRGATFGNLSPAEDYVIRELLRGTRKSIRAVGSEAMQSYSCSENPAEALIRRYGQPQLMRLHKELVKNLEDIA